MRTPKSLALSLPETSTPHSKEINKDVLRLAQTFRLQGAKLSTHRELRGFRVLESGSGVWVKMQCRILLQVGVESVGLRVLAVQEFWAR